MSSWLSISRQNLLQSIRRTDMTVKGLFEQLRTFPDWNVDVVVKVDGDDILKDILYPLECDSRNGNIILEVCNK